jgi:uncharacterized protein (TIGR03437 family)
MHISRSLVPSLLIATRCLALPLSFEERDPRHFLARVANSTVELRANRVILRDVTLRFLGAAHAARLEGLGPTSPSTYLRAGFVRTFPQFPQLAIHDLYPGVDAVFYGSGDNLEYDLKIAGGVSLDRIRVSLEGARDVRIDDLGNLTIQTPSGVLRQMRPRVFQRNREILAQYVMLTSNQVGIRLGKYDRRSPLTVDPVLSFVKYFGGSGGSSANAIATDAQGNIYAAGQTNAVDFPTTSNSFEPKFTPPLQVLTNAGKTIRSLRVGTATSAGVVGGTKDGTILYAATSNGILLSGDSGATWRLTAPLPVDTTNTGLSPAVNAIALDPLDPATILVATNVGLFGTDSGGEFWGQRHTGLPVSASGFVSVSSVFYSPTDPLLAYATTSAPSFLAKSTDAGNTWTLLDPTYPGEPAPNLDPFPNVVATLSPNGSILYAINDNGTLLKSSDGGTTWMKLAGFFGSMSIMVDPSNSNTIYVLDQLGLHKSTDGGSTFVQLATPPGNIQSFALDSSEALYVIGTNLLYVSTDSGKTFAAVPNVASFEINSVSALAGKVYVGSVTPPVPFVMKLDPSGSHILYSTFLGGSFGDSISGIAVDSAGSAVVVGSTFSTSFPVTAPASKPPSSTKADGFVAKLSADGTHLIYSTELGGSKTATVQAVALDSSGAVYVTGSAFSSDFPTTANAFQKAPPSTTCARDQGNPFTITNLGSHAFVSKLSSDGKSLVYSTFLTGSCGSVSYGIAVDASDDAVVVGYTTSTDFPVSAHSYQSAFPSFIGGSTGQSSLDAGFVSKLSPAEDKLIASTFLGGGYTTEANALTLDTSGNVYVTGFTQGIAPGATPGAYQTKVVDHCTPSISIGPGVPYTGSGDAFVIKLDAALSSAAFLTYLGGACNDSGSSIALDASGNIWVSGSSVSPDFPLKDPFQVNGIVGSPIAGFVSEFNADASQLLFSSFSRSTDLALTPTAVYLAGANGTSTLVAKIDPASTPAISIDSVNPVVAFPPGSVGPFGNAIAPGSLIQITGRDLGPATKVNGQLDTSGKLPFVLAGTSVFFDNIPAPLISVEATSIVCFVPFEVASSTEMSVLSNGQRSNAVLAGVAPSAPQILSVANQDGTANSVDHPAKLGSVISLYVSGLGETNPPGDDGLTNAAPLPVPLAPVNVYLPLPMSFPLVTPQFVGAAPGMIAGITQVNAQLPTAISVAGGVITIGVNSASAPVYVTK